MSVESWRRAEAERSLMDMGVYSGLLGIDWDVNTADGMDFESGENPFEKIPITPPPSAGANMADGDGPSTMTKAPPRSPVKRLRRMSNGSSGCFDRDEGSADGLWNSGDRSVLSQGSGGGSPEAGRLDFEMLDLSSTSDQANEPRRSNNNDSQEKGFSKFNNSSSCADLGDSSHGLYGSVRSLNRSSSYSNLNASAMSGMGTVARPTVARASMWDREGEPDESLPRTPSNSSSNLAQVLTYGAPATPSPRLPADRSMSLDADPLRRYSFSPSMHRRASRSRALAAGFSPSQQRAVPAARPTPASRTYQNDFFDFREIGRGSFGKVYKCIRKMDLRPYAVKEVVTEFRSDRDRERMLKEIYALSAIIDNVHIIRYYNAWEQDGKLYIQTELCHGTLAQLRNNNGAQGDSVVRTVLSHIATGLTFIHEKGIVHLDVKPENIYTTSTGMYKLGDLGLASLADASSKDSEGDKRYLSREMLQSDKCDLRAADVFSLGVSIYELASPTPLPSQGDAYHALRDGQAPPLPVPPELDNMIRVMMHPDPVQRPTARQVIESPVLLPLLKDEFAPCLRAPLHPIPASEINNIDISANSAQAKMKTRAIRAEREIEKMTEKIRLLDEELLWWKVRGVKEDLSVRIPLKLPRNALHGLDLQIAAPLGSSPTRPLGPNIQQRRRLSSLIVPRDQPAEPPHPTIGIPCPTALQDATPEQQPRSGGVPPSPMRRSPTTSPPTSDCKVRATSAPRMGQMDYFRTPVQQAEPSLPPSPKRRGPTATPPTSLRIGAQHAAPQTDEQAGLSHGQATNPDLYSFPSPDAIPLNVPAGVRNWLQDPSNETQSPNVATTPVATPLLINTWASLEGILHEYRDHANEHADNWYSKGLESMRKVSLTGSPMSPSSCRGSQASNSPQSRRGSVVDAETDGRNLTEGSQSRRSSLFMLDSNKPMSEL